MIFKQLKNGQTKPFHLDNENEIVNDLSFEVVEKMLYDGHDEILKNRIQKEIDEQIFPDLIASLLQNLYKRGFVRTKAFMGALASTTLTLTSEKANCEFLGLIQKGEEEKKPEFYKSFKSKPNGYEFQEKVDSLTNIIEPKDLGNAFNIFFVAGCQSIEMLDPRVKQAAIVISELIKSDLLNDTNTKVILSGWNNAKEGKYQKVKFTNESAIMTNLLLHKLEHYLNSYTDKIFSYKNIVPEMESADTKQNITGLLKMVHKIKTDSGNTNQKFNFFVVSSTFHLLQIQGGIKIQISDSDSILNKLIPNRNYDFFFVGSENPLHFFKTSDDGYMKLLFNWTIHKNFKFLRGQTSIKK